MTLGAALCMTALVLGFADDPNVGDVENPTRRNRKVVDGNGPRTPTVVYTAVGDQHTSA